LEKTYWMAIDLGDIYLKCTAKEQGFKQPARWNKKVEAAANPSFNSVAGSIQLHDNDMLNFLNNYGYISNNLVHLCIF